jgi:hypothetical protein
VIANNCGLTFLPLLPPPTEGHEDEYEFYFDGNPLTPEFQAIYDRFVERNDDDWNNNQNGGAMVGGRYPASKRKARQFQEEILEEHRRILRKRGETLGAMRKVFQGPIYYKNALNNCLNFQIQSYSASIVNRAALQINIKFKVEGIKGQVICQIHDQLVCQVIDEDVERACEIVQDCMENTTKLDGVELIAIPEVAKNFRDGH